MAQVVGARIAGAKGRRAFIRGLVAARVRIAVASPAPDWLFGTTAICPAFKLLPALVLAGLSGAAQANPQGGVVVGGSAQIVESAPNRLDINQSSERAAINWGSFSIGRGEITNFNQPSANAVALNRVTGNSRSQIDGLLSANGNIVVVNPNGIVFGRDSQVNVGGIIASTMDI